MIDKLKAEMLAGRFDYLAARGRVSGVRDNRMVFHVVDGHHRVVAALEILQESGDTGPLLQLLAWGKWDDTARAHPESRPLPSRHWWGAFRNWIGW
jgi:filamentous hemagglutinin